MKKINYVELIDVLDLSEKELKLLKLEAGRDERNYPIYRVVTWSPNKLHVHAICDNLEVAKFAFNEQKGCYLA